MISELYAAELSANRVKQASDLLSVMADKNSHRQEAKIAEEQLVNLLSQAHAESNPCKHDVPRLDKIVDTIVDGDWTYTIGESKNSIDYMIDPTPLNWKGKRIDSIHDMRKNFGTAIIVVVKHKSGSVSARRYSNAWGYSDLRKIRSASKSKGHFGRKEFIESLNASPAIAQRIMTIVDHIREEHTERSERYKQQRQLNDLIESIMSNPANRHAFANTAPVSSK